MTLDFIIGSSGELSGALNIVLLFGLTILLGTTGQKLFQKFGIPQVVGCIVIGIILGNTPGLITRHTIEAIEPFTLLALGFIGFMIGSELKADIFKKYGKQFFILLFAEGIGAFIFTSLITALLIYLVKKDLHLAVSMGLVFGAIASATAPAATTNVLWEYKTRGPLTAAVLAIVALDDALALTLYRAATTAADAVLGLRHESFIMSIVLLMGEILGAALLGIFAGVLLNWILKKIAAEDKILGFSFALLMLVVGISIAVDMDPILPAMIFGVTLVNIAPRRSSTTFALVEKFSPPVYTAFFVIAGAHMEFGKILPWVLVMVAGYTLARTLGKFCGAWFGAKISDSPPAVRKYLGLCLLSQAGVAIGLAILAGQKYNAGFGQAIVIIIMTSTFFLEILGPMAVKLGVKKAGEVGMNVTEEDLAKTYKVADMMDKKVPQIPAGTSLSELIKIMGDTDSSFYPLIDKNEKLIGAVTLEGIRNTFTTRELTDWLVALDIVEPIVAEITPEITLSEAFEKMRRYNIDYIPVVSSPEERKFLGVLGTRSAHRQLSAEVLAKQKEVDSMYQLRTA